MLQFQRRQEQENSWQLSGREKLFLINQRKQWVLAKQPHESGRSRGLRESENPKSQESKIRLWPESERKELVTLSWVTQERVQVPGQDLVGALQMAAWRVSWDDKYIISKRE